MSFFALALSVSVVANKNCFCNAVESNGDYQIEANLISIDSFEFENNECCFNETQIVQGEEFYEYDECSENEKIELKENEKTRLKEDENINEKFNINSQTPADTVPSRNYTVVIDPGHGGSDPGSIGYKTKVFESKLNLEMSLLLKEKLENAGINVVMTREDENGLAEGRGKTFKKEDMKKRKELIKNVRPNLVISLHQNSYTNHKLRGAQVFYDKTSDISKQIADFIQEEFVLNLDHSTKSTSPGDYFMLKCTYAPSVIVECGFLSNEQEEKLLLTKEYQEKIVNCIYRGIIKFLQTK